MGSNSNFLSHRLAYPVNTNRAQIPLNRAIEMWGKVIWHSAARQS
jgi:hypothetical protein